MFDLLITITCNWIHNGDGPSKDYRLISRFKDGKLFKTVAVCKQCGQTDRHKHTHMHTNTHTCTQTHTHRHTHIYTTAYSHMLARVWIGVMERTERNWRWSCFWQNTEWPKMSHVCCLIKTAGQLYKCNKIFIITELSTWNQTHVIRYQVGLKVSKLYARGSQGNSHAAANYNRMVQQYPWVKIYSEQMYGTNKTTQSNRYTILIKMAYTWNYNEHKIIMFMIWKIQTFPKLLRHMLKQLTYISSVLEHLELFIHEP